MTHEEMVTSRNYDPESMRVLLPALYLKAMPFKRVTSEELTQLKCEWDFNPPYCYPEDVVILIDEVGHDSKYRYMRGWK